MSPMPTKWGAAAIALAGLAAVPAAGAPDDCLSGAATYCEGDQSQGVNYGSGFVGGFNGHLVVRNLTAPIVPAAHTIGLRVEVYGGSEPGVSIATDGTVVVETQNNSGIRALSVGGPDGTHGFSGGAVVVDNKGSVATSGDGSAAIWASSQGGPGGTRMTGVIGQYVGLDSRGGQVEIFNTGDLVTHGAHSPVIFAESIGGDGGPDGWDANAGGRAGNLKVENSGDIESWGISSTGIYARVWGGDGGQPSGAAYDGRHGGHAAFGANWMAIDNSGNITTHAADSHGIYADVRGGHGSNGTNDVNINAFGGRGGNGGNVESVFIANTGNIVTLADGSIGILALGQGGYGGNGGEARGGGGTGGNGGSGGWGGNVRVEAGGTITTSGDKSHAILAFSRGGDAGYGGFGAGVAGWGGNGGGSGAGGMAQVNVYGAIATGGDESHGVLAQSFGGLGAQGGGASGLYGSAGNGGKGGTAGLANAIAHAGSSIITEGYLSAGILAQSIGGIGGSGSGAFGVFAAEGGGGAAGGDGGAVNIAASGTIETFGMMGMGIHAQSLGGGGGSGAVGAGLIAFGGSGSDASAGGDVTITQTGSVLTHGEGAHAVFGQSVGGGGGSADMGQGLVAIGGNHNPAGINYRDNHGGVIAVTNSGFVGTTGKVAAGIFAQSVGGGGGNGGGSAGWMTIGGIGHAGGNGGVVTVENNGTVQTAGERAHGIIGQSVGGGGGSGGDVISGGVVMAFSLGGLGNSGGDGGAVTIANSGEVSTLGYNASGILALSTGKGGGNAGDAVSTGLNLFTMSIGGVAAGGGGSGGTIEVSNTGTIQTHGIRAYGIEAISVGGGGGSGGAAASSSIAWAFSGSVAIGGIGGTGNKGGLVDVENSGTIVTRDFGSHGIFALSQGGGGGKGGLAKAYAVSISTSNAISMTVGVGGAGGDGNIGDTARITNSGDVVTVAGMSSGLVARSIGGGGGEGGNSSAHAIPFAPTQTVALSYTVGGHGGNGNVGGLAEIINTGPIQVVSPLGLGRGIVAQSVGGGGGEAGDATGGVTAFATKGAASITVSLGGSGGTGNHGGTVRVTNSGQITSSSTFSSAILAQSVGAGGGIAGSGSGDATVIDSQPGLVLNKLGIIKKTSGSAKSIAVGVGIGGTGGAGGDGGVVWVENSGTIQARGFLNFGILAQSVGAGGGIGGAGAMSTAKIPGSAGVEIGAGFGGGGGASGDGGQVTVVNTGGVATWGHDSAAIYAQSVGAGGGIGALGTGEGGVMALSIVLGGRGGSSGNGGDVDVRQQGAITTAGHRSYGIFAQSVGGGGGMGGVGEADYYGKITMGGDATSGGNGGTVTVDVSGTITTTGGAAHGILAQSVGGGGGIGGSTGALPIEVAGHEVHEGWFIGVFSADGDGGAGGDGGAVMVNSSGTITTTGYNAYGIVAHSVGGGGGIRGNALDGGAAVGAIGSSGNAGTASAVTVVHDGSIYATGISASGILAQSSAKDGGGDISVTLAGTGTVVGGSGDGTGIVVDGGADNTITIGADSSLTALSGVAIRASGGNDVVENHGTILGDVLLGTGANRFDNLIDASFTALAEVNLGGGTFTNAGVLNIGGTGHTGAVGIGGDFVQTATGVLEVDAAFSQSTTRDVVVVYGDAVVDGMVRVSPTSLVKGVRSVVLTASSLAGNPDVFDTPMVDFRLIQTAAGLYVVVDGVDLATLDVAPEFSNLTRHLQDAFNAGAPDLGPLLAYLGDLPDQQTLESVLRRLEPEPLVPVALNGIANMTGFVNSMMSCQPATGPHAALAEVDCDWARVTKSSAMRQATPADPGYQGDGLQTQFGRQAAIDGNNTLGLSGGLTLGQMAVDGGTRSTGTAVNAGIVLKHVEGPWLSSAALGLGASFSHTTRVPLPGAVATADSLQLLIAAKLRQAYLLEFGAGYIKPLVDLDLSFAHTPGFRETGAGALGLVIDPASRFGLAVSPGIELGATLPLGDDGHIRPYLAAGVTFDLGEPWTFTSRLAGSPMGTAPFSSSSAVPPVTGMLALGADIFMANDLSLKLQYQARFSDMTQDQSGSMKFMLKF